MENQDDNNIENIITSLSNEDKETNFLKNNIESIIDEFIGVNITDIDTFVNLHYNFIDMSLFRSYILHNLTIKNDKWVLNKDILNNLFKTIDLYLKTLGIFIE